MDEAERCHTLAFIFGGRIILHDTPENVRRLLADRDIFEVRYPYSREMIERLGRLPGVETLNPFGNVVRVIAGKGAYTRESLHARLGMADLPREAVQDSESSIEDVFVNLTQRGRNQERRKAEREI
jgi:ABC-2 type transport system ATP-binding protein